MLHCSYPVGHYTLGNVFCCHKTIAASSSTKLLPRDYSVPQVSAVCRLLLDNFPNHIVPYKLRFTIVASAAVAVRQLQKWLPCLATWFAWQMDASYVSEAVKTKRTSIAAASKTYGRLLPSRCYTVMGIRLHVATQTRALSSCFAQGWHSIS